MFFYVSSAPKLKKKKKKIRDKLMIYLSYEMDLVQAFFPLHNMCTSSLKHNGKNEKKKC